MVAERAVRKISSDRMATASCIREQVDAGRTCRPALRRSERRPSCAVVVREKCRRLVRRRPSFHGRIEFLGVRERRRGLTGNNRLEFRRHTVPVVDRCWLQTGIEAHVLRSPVEMPDDRAPYLLDRSCTRADLIDPLCTRRGRLEVEELVVRLRPQFPFRSQRRTPGRDAGPRSEFYKSSEYVRHRSTDIAVVCVTEHPVVDPLLDRNRTVNTNWPGSGKACFAHRSLNALHVPEIGRIPKQLVDLQRDARTVLEQQAECGADTARKREDLRGRRLELLNLLLDRGAVDGAQDIEDDGRLGIR